VHVAGLAADHGFVNLDFACQLAAVLPLLRESDPMEHKPRGLLSDIQSPRNLTRTDSVLAIQNHPHCRKPSIKAKGRVLEYGADLNGELPLGMPGAALPPQLILEEANILAATDRANNTILPFSPTSDEVIDTGLLVREVQDRFLKGFGFVDGFHVSSLTQNSGLRKYIIALVRDKWGCLTSTMRHKCFPQ
jgi:hypothetical protein